MYEVGPTSITIDHVNNFNKKKKNKFEKYYVLNKLSKKKKKVLVGTHKDCLPYPICHYNNIRAMIKTLFFFHNLWKVVRNFES